MADLTLVPWHRSGATAIQAPSGVAGIAAALVAGGLVAWLAFATLPPRPMLRPPGRATLALAAAALVLATVRLTTDAHRLAVGAWLSLVLAALLVADLALAPRARSAIRSASVKPSATGVGAGSS